MCSRGMVEVNKDDDVDNHGDDNYESTMTKMATTSLIDKQSTRPQATFK